MGTETPSVAVCVVTHNSAADLPACLTGIAELDYRPLEVVVVDCASTDDSVAIARRFPVDGLPLRLVRLSENLGFTGGMNRALGATEAPFIVSLNPDARPAPDFVRRLVERVRLHPDLRVGAVTGRLLRPHAAGMPPVLDACGMRLTLSWRHLDRGSGQLDDGRRWNAPERVFGATGAASLWRRAALEDVAVEGQAFLEEFHSYREDAELCFRLRDRGWEVLYEPAARCQHRRRVEPRTRRSHAAEVNFHSLKNRYLLRAYHQLPGNLMLTAPPTLSRDLLAFLYVLLRERSSLPAYRWLWDNRGLIGRRRRLIRSRRTGSAWAINQWFLFRGRQL